MFPPDEIDLIVRLTNIQLENHQVKNAESIVGKHGAIMIEEENLSDFQIQFEELLNNDKKQKELSRSIKKLALPNSTKEIVDEILKLIE